MSTSDHVLNRSRRLRALIGEHTRGTLREGFVAVMCDGCARIVRTNTPEELAPLIDDWHIGERGGPDYCPECHAR